MPVAASVAPIPVTDPSNAKLRRASDCAEYASTQLWLAEVPAKTSPRRAPDGDPGADVDSATGGEPGPDGCCGRQPHPHIHRRATQHAGDLGGREPFHRDETENVLILGAQAVKGGGDGTIRVRRLGRRRGGPRREDPSRS
ncbi:hypothetical protein GCM10009827_070310 [Dactylosporangium maewongense]|uniref:Uncharacterized protein n=1 Tax=Dactylosporangium maewongense TaxID=634393 RepID=A0ABN2BK58_9ACTN